MPGIRIQVLSTQDIDEATVRAMFERAFAEEVRDEDWEHCVGGIHVVAFEGDVPVGHAALVERELLQDGRAIRTGYVEGLAVEPSHQRRGIGSLIMDAIEPRIRAEFGLGALSSSDEALAFYRRRGWVPWRGQTAVRMPDGEVKRTPDDDDSVFVMPVAGELDPSGLLVCDWRLGDVW
jgi:aminoglycoside 2'-N-acetyltransferase I